jgi:Mannosyltransferase (PIG-V)
MVAIVPAQFGAGIAVPLTLLVDRVRSCMFGQTAMMSAMQRIKRNMRNLAGDPALPLFLWSRAAIWLLALVVVVGFDGALNARRGEWDSSRLHELGSAVDVWARWDSDWFLRIAEHGYSWPSSTPAFFPLYPLLVAGLGRALLGHYLLAGVLVSLAAGSAAFVLLYRLTSLRLGEDAARHTVLFLAVAPTSLFFGAVYSESLFLLLAVATFLLAERGRFWEAGTTAGLALLTRSAGVALLPALVVLAWRRPDRRRSLAGIALAPLLFAIYPAVLAIWIGHPLAFLDAQKVVWERRLSPAGPLGGVVAAVQDRELLDLGVAFLLIALGVVAWRRIGPAYGLYTLTSVALPLTFVSDKVPLWSMQRFAVVAFPAFMALATLARGRRAVAITATILAAGLCVYVVRWALWYWVA